MQYLCVTIRGAKELCIRYCSNLKAIFYQLCCSVLYLKEDLNIKCVCIFSVHVKPISAGIPNISVVFEPTCPKHFTFPSLPFKIKHRLVSVGEEWMYSCHTGGRGKWYFSTCSPAIWHWSADICQDFLSWFSLCVIGVCTLKAPSRSFFGVLRTK